MGPRSIQLEHSHRNPRLGRKQCLQVGSEPQQAWLAAAAVQARPYPVMLAALVPAQVIAAHLESPGACRPSPVCKLGGQGPWTRQTAMSNALGSRYPRCSCWQLRARGMLCLPLCEGRCVAGRHSSPPAGTWTRAPRAPPRQKGECHAWLCKQGSGEETWALLCVRH